VDKGIRQLGTKKREKDTVQRWEGGGERSQERYSTKKSRGRADKIAVRHLAAESGMKEGGYSTTHLGGSVERDTRPVVPCESKKTMALEDENSTSSAEEGEGRNNR